MPWWLKPRNLVDDNFNGVIDESPAYEDNVYVGWTRLGVDWIRWILAPCRSVVARVDLGSAGG